MTIPMHEPTSRPGAAAPRFRELADAIGVVSIVNTLVAWDPRQCRVSPGARILLRMLDILAGKTPLYRLAERLPLTDVEILVGQGCRPEDFTDDRRGRALNKRARAGSANVFSAWAWRRMRRRALRSRPGIWIRPPGWRRGPLPRRRMRGCIRPMAP